MHKESDEDTLSYFRCSSLAFFVRTRGKWTNESVGSLNLKVLLSSSPIDGCTDRLCATNQF